jgi:hypothetical protein
MDASDSVIRNAVIESFKLEKANRSVIPSTEAGDFNIPLILNAQTDIKGPFNLRICFEVVNDEYDVVKSFTEKYSLSDMKKGEKRKLTYAGNYFDAQNTASKIKIHIERDSERNEFWFSNSIEYDFVPVMVTQVFIEDMERIIGLIENNLMSVEIPDEVTIIGDYAFAGNKNLSEIKIPSSVKSIGRYAFSECSALETLEIPETVTTLGAHMFKSSGIKEIEIHGGIELIPNAMFMSSKLEKITLNEGLKKIWRDAFNSCTSLFEITVPSTVIHIDNWSMRIGTASRKGVFKILPVAPPTLPSTNVFNHLEALYVPDESLEEYKNATTWSTYADIIYPLSEYIE